MVQLAEKPWPEAGKLFEETDVAILPVGSTEQHGPHNPLGTDHFIAGRMAYEVGEKTGVPVLPCIPIGVSSHHRQFPGTLWVSPTAFRGYILEIALSAASHGVRKILVVNGHGGNDASLMEVAGGLRMDHGIFVAVASAFPPMDGHAGEGETSANLYFHGHLVDMDLAVDTEQNRRLGSLELEGVNYVFPGRFAWDTLDLSPTGVMGSAGATIRGTTATEEKGRSLMEPYIEELATLVEEMKKADIEGLLPKPHK